MLTESDRKIILIQDSLDIKQYAWDIDCPQDIEQEIGIIRSIMVRLTKDKEFRIDGKLYTRSVDRFNQMFKLLLMRRDALAKERNSTLKVNGP